MRITKKFFIDLGIWMIGFGVLVGIIFPFFIRSFGVSREIAFSWKFITSCILAGAIVGAVNIIISRTVVVNRFRLLTSKMQMVHENLLKVMNGEDLVNCNPEKCHIEVTSNDEIGRSAHAFNCLIDTLTESLNNERKVKDYTAMLTSSLELKPLADKALHKIIEITKTNAGSILIENEGKLIPLKTLGIHYPEKLINNTDIQEVLKNPQRKIINIPENIVIDGILVDYKPNQIILEPLIYNDVSIGIMILATLDNLDNEKINLIRIFSQSLSLALHNAIIHEQIQKLATIDPLTGLLNKRYGMIRLREEYSRAVRTEHPLGVVIFDIDFFKKINDTFGHLAGDRLLVNIARITKSIIREGDILMRFGGEEFCMILPGASKEDSFKMAERVRFAIENSETNYAGYTIKATVSLGVTSFPEANANQEQDLISIADKALYISKETGRNKTTIK